MAKSKNPPKKKKALQIHSEESLERSRALSADEVALFLENFRLIHSANPSKSKLISIKIPESLLTAFRLKAELQGVKYQTQIKNLMEEWLRSQS